MRRVLIAGIGNVLLGDDGVGPYIVRTLESCYSFAPEVAAEDLGTPSLDFIDQLAGLDALIVIDSVQNGQAPGTITLYRKEDLAKLRPSLRMDSHSPAITESLLAAEVFFGISPKEILLIGVSGESFNAGCNLSEPVRHAVASALQSVVAELDRLSIPCQVKHASDPSFWWSAQPA